MKLKFIINAITNLYYKLYYINLDVNLISVYKDNDYSG